MRLNVFTTSTIAIAVTLLLGFAPNSLAKPLKGKDRPKTPIVQFNSMLVPQASTRSRAKFLPVTPLIEIKRGNSITDFCKFSVRVNEAILMTMHSNPVTGIKDDEVVLSEDLHKLLVDRINQASGGKKQVTKVHILATTLIMGTGVSGRLPYATIAGCKEFRSLEDKGGVMPIE